MTQSILDRSRIQNNCQLWTVVSQGCPPEPLATTKCLFGWEQRTLHPVAQPLATDQENARWNTVHDSPLSILFITMVSFVEDHCVPGYSSRWPHHSHLLYLNPGRKNSGVSKTWPVTKLLREKKHLETSFLTGAMEASTENFHSLFILPEKWGSELYFWRAGPVRWQIPPSFEQKQVATTVEIM